jgi:hypothetical protein
MWWIRDNVAVEAKQRIEQAKSGVDEGGSLKGGAAERSSTDPSEPGKQKLVAGNGPNRHENGKIGGKNRENLAIGALTEPEREINHSGQVKNGNQSGNLRSPGRLE